MMSGEFGGILQIIIYIFAFLAPTFAGIYLSEKEKSGNIKDDIKYLTIGRDKLGVVLLSAAPILLAVLFISYITSLLMLVLFGRESGVTVTEDPFTATVIHALLPAILEETAFRYLPLKLLGGRSPRGAVIASAFFFSLIHGSLFSIPYAFAAGLMFMALDILTDSILPSVSIHFINNVLALMTMGVYGFVLEIPVAFIIVGAAALLSCLLLFFERKRLLGMVMAALPSGEGYVFSPEPLFFAVPALIIAVSELFI